MTRPVSATAYLGTADGVHRLRGNGQVDGLGLEGRRITAIHAEGEVVLAGSYEDGLFRSADGGASWTPVTDGLTAPCFRFLGPDPTTPDALLAGTEPARLFRSTDAGVSWTEVEAVRVPGHEHWYLPYSPRAGALRNVYGPPDRPGRLLAAIEVGGLLRSDDAGATCAVEPVIHDEDIHHVTGHPDDPDLLFVSLGSAAVADLPEELDRTLGGIARSRDGGASWDKVETDYTRATLVPPGHPDLLLAGPALRVGRRGRIVVSADAGDTWEPAGAGLEEPMDDMVELFVPAPDGDVWAICSRGRLLRATPGEWHWRPVLPDGAGLEVKSVAFAE